MTDQTTDTTPELSDEGIIEAVRGKAEELNRLLLVMATKRITPDMSVKERKTISGQALTIEFAKFTKTFPSTGSA